MASIYSDQLGDIDGSLFLRYLDAQSSEGLYVNHGGLYLLPYEVATVGIVDEVCIFGYINSQFEYQLLNENRMLDPNTRVRPFLYVMLYRPLDENTADNQTVYRIVGKPAVVYHSTMTGCLSQSDGLEWQVQRGDRIGAFIPDNCISATEVLNSDTFFSSGLDSGEVELLCPTQINLVVEDDECYYAYFHPNISEMEFTEIRSEQFKREQTKLNLKVEFTQQNEGK